MTDLSIIVAGIGFLLVLCRHEIIRAFRGR
jgi:hypothetical protein